MYCDTSYKKPSVILGNLLNSEEITSYIQNVSTVYSKCQSGKDGYF